MNISDIPVEYYRDKKLVVTRLVTRLDSVSHERNTSIEIIKSLQNVNVIVVEHYSFDLYKSIQIRINHIPPKRVMMVLKNYKVGACSDLYSSSYDSSSPIQYLYSQLTIQEVDYLIKDLLNII